MRLPLITCGMLGVQAVWSIEMSQASPYLIELGLPKALMSLVFVAGQFSLFLEARSSSLIRTAERKLDTVKEQRRLQRVSGRLKLVVRC